MIRALALAFALGAGAAAADATEIRIGYLREDRPRQALSLIEVPAEDDGLAGAELAIADNNTTGRFMNQSFVLDEAVIEEGGDPVPAVEELAAAGAKFVLADLPADALLRAADAGRDSGLVFFNIAASDDRLREEECRANVIHTVPSYSMLADALAQYFVWKRWLDWFLVVGSHPGDQLFGEALRRAATRFGAKIVAERVFEDRGGARQTDSGIALIQRQIPVFTQEAPSYDVLVAADESEVFAAYLPYRTWDPRPVAGSAGLRPMSWHGSHSQWGAIQLQSRFGKAFTRPMSERDMQAWSAVRMVGEAATRTNSGDPAEIVAYMKGPEFALAAFKGQKLTLRDWNLQLRQPILLVDGRIVVTVSPQEGFLHQFSELDTLGIDRPESACKLQ